MPGTERWIDLVDPDAAAISAAVTTQVAPIDLELLLRAARSDRPSRPRFAPHGDYVFGILIMPTVDADGDVAFHEIDVIATLDRLVTVRKSLPSGAAADIADIVETANRDDLRTGEALYLLVDEVAERFLFVVDRFDDDIDHMEDNVGTWESERVRSRISSMRHEILEVRRVLTPTRDAARAVLDDRVEIDGATRVFPHEVELRFADAYDKLLRATDGLDLARDLLAGVRDFHQAQVAQDQNEVMKRLTVIASVLLVPTFIVGVYGQNLHGGPEFGWRHGYWFSWALIIASTAGQLLFYRRKGWI